MEARIAELETEVADLKKLVEGKDAENKALSESNVKLETEVADLKKAIAKIRASKGGVPASEHITVVKGSDEIDINASILPTYKANGWKVKG